MKPLFTDETGLEINDALKSGVPASVVALHLWLSRKEIVILNSFESMNDLMNMVAFQHCPMCETYECCACPFHRVGRQRGCSTGSAFDDVMDASTFDELVANLDILIGELRKCTEYERHSKIEDGCK